MKLLSDENHLGYAHLFVAVIEDKDDHRCDNHGQQCDGKTEDPEFREVEAKV